MTHDVPKKAAGMVYSFKTMVSVSLTLTEPNRAFSAGPTMRPISRASICSAITADLCSRGVILKFSLKLLKTLTVNPCEDGSNNLVRGFTR